LSSRDIFWLFFESNMSSFEWKDMLPSEESERGAGLEGCTAIVMEGKDEEMKMGESRV
jgi:hypothetical protein